MKTVARRVLVVDDHHDSTDAFSMLLKADGHEVRSAYDGVTAIKIAKQFQPEFVFLDLGLPDWDGYAIARALRDLPDGRKIRLVAVTGWSGKEYKRRTAEAGFDAYLVKPVDPDQIEYLLMQ